MNKSPEERAKELLEKQLALKEKMKREGKHIYQKNVVSSSAHHIGEWLTPTLKAIKRKKKQEAKKKVVVPIRKAAQG